MIGAGAAEPGITAAFQANLGSVGGDDDTNAVIVIGAVEFDRRVLVTVNLSIRPMMTNQVECHRNYSVFRM